MNAFAYSSCLENSLVRFCVASLGILCFATACHGQLIGQTVDTPSLVKKHFTRLEVYGGNSRSAMKVVPVLYWNNKTRGPENPSGQNVTALWIHDGRPEAVVCVWPPMPTRLITHEFCSLSRTKTIVGKFDRREFWNTKAPGIEFKARQATLFLQSQHHCGNHK